MDTDSELTLIPGDPRCHRGPPVRVGAYGSQLIDGILAPVHHSVEPVGPLVQPVCAARVPAHRGGTDVAAGRSPHWFLVYGAWRKRPCGSHHNRLYSRKTVHQKECCTSGGVSTILKDLKDAGVEIPTTSPCKSLIWPTQNPNGPWRMTVGYHKLNQAVTPIAAAGSDVISLPEQMNTPPGTSHTATELANTDFCRPVHKARQKHSAFSWQGRQYTFTPLPERYASSSALRHKLVCKDLA